MTVVSKIKRLSMVARKPKLISYKDKHIFLLSHMRSRSSVLSHVMGSNIEICVYSELHRSYYTKVDLFRMRMDLFLEEEPNDKSCKYFYDKLLNNNLIISNKLLDKVKPKIIFLIRDPESTIKSIINMGGDCRYRMV